MRFKKDYAYIFLLIAFFVFVWSIFILFKLHPVHLVRDWDIYWFEIDLMEVLGFLSIFFALKFNRRFLDLALGFTIAAELLDFILDTSTSYFSRHLYRFFIFGFLELFVVAFCVFTFFKAKR